MLGDRVDNQRIADVARHQVPDLSLIGAHEDPLPLHAGEDNLKIACRARVRVRIERHCAIRVENHVGRVARQHQGPGLARVLAPPDTTVRAAQSQHR